MIKVCYKSNQVLRIFALGLVLVEAAIIQWTVF